MLKAGILNPAINSLLSRVRHTNTVVIADRGFPYWPQIEIVDIALVDDIPVVMDVLRALRSNFQIGAAFMAEEFRTVNSNSVRSAFQALLEPIAISYEPHLMLKKRVPNSIGLIRTGDTIQYANIILESA